MPTDLDWHDALERAIGPAPDAPTSIDDVLTAGRRGVRRRRLALAGAGVAAAAVVAGAAGALGALTPHTETTTIEPAGSGSGSVSPSVSASTTTASGPAIPTLTAAPGVSLPPDQVRRHLASGVVTLYDETNVTTQDGQPAKGWAWLDQDGKVWFAVGPSDADGMAIRESQPASDFANRAAIVAAFRTWLRTDGPFEFGPAK